MQKMLVCYDRMVLRNVLLKVVLRESRMSEGHPSKG